MPGVRRGRTDATKRSNSNNTEDSPVASSSNMDRRSSSSSLEVKRQTSSRGSPLLKKKSSTKAGQSSAGVDKMASRVVSLLRKTSSSSKAMGKRTIRPPRTFSFDDPTPSPKKKPRKSDVESKELFYNRGEYLALRNDEGGFWLCRALMRVFDTTTRVKIQWLYEVKGKGQGDNLYGVDWHNVDFVDTDTILTHVKLQKMSTHTYKLSPDQREKAEKSLQKALNAEQGIVDESDESEEESEESSSEEEEPAPKKARKDTKTKSKTKSKATGKGKKAPVKKGKASTSKKADDGGKRKLTAAERKNPNLLLRRNSKVQVLDKDPFLYASKPVTSLTAFGKTKQLFSAVYQNNLTMLQGLVDDLKNVYQVDPIHSVSVKKTPLDVAIEMGNVKAVQLLAKEQFNRDRSKAKRSAPVQNLLQKVETGRYNYRSLGVRRIAELAMSRGSREGNNALTKDTADVPSYGHGSHGKSHYIRRLMEVGAKKTLIDAFFRSIGETDQYSSCLEEQVIHAIRRGHRKLAGHVTEEAIKRGMMGFNFLMKEVLLFDKEDLRPKIGIPSVRTKNYSNMLITPLHCAAINPNVKYISRLLSIAPEYSVTDKNGRKPIHYAAVCEGSGPLELLLKRGVDPEDADNQSMTPLMLAAEAGRVHNIEVLMKKAEEIQKKREQEGDEDEDDEEDEEGVPPQTSPAWGTGGINRTVCRPSKYYGMTPLHIAIENGQTNAVKSLLKHGADIHKTLGASKNKCSPLIMACYRGDLELVKLLHKHGALIEQRDKLKRTALTHAVMNGHAHLVSYLLSVGADATAADSSGNTCMHYAVGYGWQYCMDLLLEAGADYDTPNDWKLTPLGIAFLKGHMGLADKLLQKPHIDINFKDDKGMTLVAIACSSPLDAGIVEQIEYFVLKKKADCTIKDFNGYSPLHHLASNAVQVQAKGQWGVYVTDKAAADRSVKIAEILLKNGCRADDTTTDKQTPVMLAIQEGNAALVKFLVEQGGTITRDRNEHGENLLHLMAKQCMDTSLGPVLQLVHESMVVPDGEESPLEAMARDVDHEGFTPLLRACHVYRSKETIKGGAADAGQQSGTNSDAGSDIDEDEDEDQDMDEEDEDEDEDKDDDDDGDKEEDMEEDAGDDGDQDNSKKKKFDPHESGRGFVEMLLDLCKADINQQVAKMWPTKGHVYKTEEDHYFEEVGKFTAIHFMVTNDCSTQDSSGDPSDQNAGLTLTLRYNPDLSLKNISGRAPLAHALRYKDDKGKCHSDAAVKLVEAGADPDQKSDNTKEDLQATPLGIAAELGETQLVQLMLAKGASVNERDSGGQTPLHLMMSLNRGEHDVAKLARVLLEAGADLTAVTTKWHHTPLHSAVNYNAASADATSELESILIEAGAPCQKKDKLGRMPLHYCFTKMSNPNDFSHCDPIDLCTTLTGESSDVSRHINQVDNDGNTALHMAAYRGATICTMNLVQMGADIDAKDKRDNTPLSIAVAAGHLSLAIMLIQQGADLHVSCDLDLKFEDVCSSEAEEERQHPELLWKPIEGDPDISRTQVYPVFQVCVKNNWQGVVFLLLSNLKKAGLDFFSAIEAAVNTCSYNLVLTLMRKEHDDQQLHKTNKDGQTLMHLLALQKAAAGQEELQLRVAREMLDRGVSLVKADNWGCSPLHYACLTNNIPIGKFILEKITKLNMAQKDKQGRTPFALAFWRLGERGTEAATTSNDLTQELLKRGSQVDVHCDYPPVMASRLGYTKKNVGPAMDCETLIRDLHTTRKSVTIKTSPLICAICYRDFNSVKLLLENGASPNFPDEKGRTPMMHAVRVNAVDLVKLLLDHSYVILKKPEDDNLPIPLGEENAKKRGKGKKGKTANVGKPPRARLPGKRKFTLGKSLQNADSDEEEDEMDEEDEDDEESQIVEDKTPADDINVNYRPFPKKSVVNLKLHDGRGWTVLHHLLNPLDCGTYDNVRLLVLLCESGADLNQRNSAGLRALDQALLMCAPNLIKAMQKLMGIPKVKWEKPLYAKDETKDGINWSGSVPDYRSDADKLLKKVESESKKEAEDDEKLSVVPDSHLELDPGSAEVVVDDKQETHYDTTLLKIDLTKGTWGMYNFYIMQVVYQTTKDLYILFNRWGRIGDDGQFQRTPFKTKEEAVKEFCKIFKAKTGNDWKKIKEFSPVPKKYRLVQLEEKQLKGGNLQDMAFDIESKLPSKLPKEVQGLMKQLTNVAWMKAAMTDHRLDVDCGYMPFGRIKRQVLLKAREMLAELAPLIHEMDKKMENPHDNAEACAELAGKIADKSNEYHQMVPRSDYVYDKARPVTDREALKEEMDRIKNLLDIEIVSKVLAGAQYRVKDVNPLDYVYRALGCQIQMANREDQEVQLLLKYLQGTMSHHRTNLSERPYKIEAVYKLSRPGEAQRLGDLHLTQHRMLLHGTGNANLVGILAHGLLTAPPEAPKTGAIFGEGIYFADQFVKSAGYAWNLEGVSEQFMLVAQVGLGHCKKFYTINDDETWEGVPKGYNSKQIVGEYIPHPQGDITLSTGAVVSSGDLWQQPLPNSIDRWSRVENSEYIIPDSKQICLRYLVQFREK